MYLCLQLLLGFPPDLLYWWSFLFLFLDDFWSLRLFWYLLSFTQDLPATSKVHQRVMTAVTKTTPLLITNADVDMYTKDENFEQKRGKHYYYPA